MHILSRNAYRMDLDETECTSFSMKDKEILEKYNEIWEKVSNILKNRFNGQLICNENI